MEALAWESDLTAMRLKGDKIHTSKRFWLTDKFSFSSEKSVKSCCGCTEELFTEQYERDELNQKCGYGGYIKTNGHTFHAVFKDNERNGYSKYDLSSN